MNPQPPRSSRHIFCKRLQNHVFTSLKIRLSSVMIFPILPKNVYFRANEHQVLRAINFTSKLKNICQFETKEEKLFSTNSGSFSCLTYLALFNGSPFAFIWTSSVLGHGVPLSKWLYTKCRSSCSGLSKIQTLLLFLNLLQYFNIF